ncbi:MAG: glycine cleavage system protein GcvH [Lentisphaeria bacterium]
MASDDRKYTKTHEWIKVEGDLTVVGITDHAQEELGDITFVELPEVDEKFEQGDEVAEIESVKAASEMFAPVSGVVAEVNEELEDNPELVNSSPFDKGWIYKFKDFDKSQLEGLLDATAYKKAAEEEE